MTKEQVVLIVDKNHSSSLIMTKRLNSLGLRADTVSTARGLSTICIRPTMSLT
jgi:hypothetical protein